MSRRFLLNTVKLPGKKSIIPNHIYTAVKMFTIDIGGFLGIFWGFEGLM